MTKDFFVSYNRADREWAEWIAWTLESKKSVQELERIKPEGQPAFPGPKPAYPTSVKTVSSSYKNAELLAAGEILDLLTTTWTTFVAQARIRNDLFETIRKRLRITEHLQYERFFQRFYPEMNAEELHLHKTVRAYTSNVISQYNRRVLDILQEHPGLLANVRRLPELKQHLIVWLAKFNGVFASTPSMCLVYVGVEEEVEFPKGVENELKKYITMHTNAPG